ncbi:MAG: adenylate kinase [Candidatus Sericytochromatia bacterium]|nr:MAG: adenylate kinase [Candidatus Sericytochromatia bacterium]
MHILFLGPPGSGKGTQSKILENKFGILQISTGDILRKAIENKTDLGNKAKSFMDEGKLVPDNLMIELIKEVFSQENFTDNWLMDGFPRTLNQAVAFDNLLSELNKKLDVAIEVDVNKDLLIKRITGRRICRNCQAPYHIDFKKPKVDDICDYCGSNDIYQRNDDKEEVVLNRLKVYKEQTLPLIDYYKKKNIYFKVDGSKNIDEITSEIVTIINKKLNINLSLKMD